MKKCYVDYITVNPSPAYQPFRLPKTLRNVNSLVFRNGDVGVSFLRDPDEKLKSYNVLMVHASEVVKSTETHDPELLCVYVRNDILFAIYRFVRFDEA